MMLILKTTKLPSPKANLYVRKMTVADHVYTAIESTLTKMPALYRYTETIPKTFLVSLNSQSWDQEDVFNREPFRRFVIAMSTNGGFWVQRELIHFIIKSLA